MSRHRAAAPHPASVVAEVRTQMSDREIVTAALSLTMGDEPYLKRLMVAGREVKLENRGRGARMGRFGGGWDFEVGIQTGSNGVRGTIIINLGRGSIRIGPKV